MFVGKSLAVTVIYAEFLIVSRVKVSSKTPWKEKLGRTIPCSKIYLKAGEYAPGPVSTLVWTVFTA